ncbi:hypothetical protein BC831DRAFT_470998 [Entophlyctis helioformis]|nr:hypothetical protein BC831DRAFT_470998 [Entophlyctis helioformis]
MDALIAIINSNSRPGGPTDEQLRAQHKALTAAATHTLCSPSASGSDPLTELNPADATLAYVMILNARFRSAPGDSNLLAFALFFARAFDPRQLVVAAQELTALGEHLDKWAETQRKPKALVRILTLLCTRLNDTSAASLGAVHLTPLHVLCLKHCILAKNYRAARPLVDTPVTDISSPVAPIRVQDFLLYHYYGGLVYVGTKSFRNAQQFFEICLHAPSNVPSAIQIEAYKRFVLVSLLLNGEAPPMAKSIPQAVSRGCRSSASAYTDLASAYASLDPSRTSSKVSQRTNMFAADKTLGLVQQCLADLVRRKIQKLTNTYLTLSLSGIAKTVDLVGVHAASDAEGHVLQMIDNGQVSATISHADGGMVSFHDIPETFDSMATAKVLEREINAAFWVDNEAAEVARRIGLSREYLQRVMSDKARPQSMSLEDD